MAKSLQLRRAFEWALERVRLRALAAIQRMHGVEVPPALRAEIVALEQQLVDSLPSTSDDIASLLSMSPDEHQFLWCVAAATVDPLLSAHLDVLGHRDGRAGISIAQVALIANFEPARARDLALRVVRGGGGIHARLVRSSSGNLATPLTGYVAVPKLISFLLGEDALDPGFAGAGRIVPLPDDVVADPVFAQNVARIRELIEAEARVAIVVEGRPGAGRRTLARIAADRPIIALDLAQVAQDSSAVVEAFAALSREALLGRALPLVAGIHILGGHDADSSHRAGELSRFAESIDGPMFLISDGAAPALSLSRPLVRLDVPVPDAATRAELWRMSLGDGVESIATAVETAAMRYSLTPGQIRTAASSTLATARGRHESLSSSAISEGVRTTVQERLGRLARRVTTKLDWDNLVLSADTRDQIDLLMTRARHTYRVLGDWGFRRFVPGTGMAALFSGPPGTGKTMVAGLIARALDLDLYRVDLSQVVSKWVGETEKQLDEVFATADTGHILLLFDEADSLFAKRTEVKGANERYANMEVNYLLQRLESFSGIALLTTNMDSSIDAAFRRRLAAHIIFPLPDEDERAELWRRMLPAEAPCADDLDFDTMAADFPAFSGANIRNASILAGYFAADAGGVIDQQTFERAAREELRSMGRIVHGAQR